MERGSSSFGAEIRGQHSENHRCREQSPEFMCQKHSLQKSMSMMSGGGTLGRQDAVTRVGLQQWCQWLSKKRKREMIWYLSTVSSRNSLCHAFMQQEDLEGQHYALVLFSLQNHETLKTLIFENFVQMYNVSSHIHPPFLPSNSSPCYPHNTFPS